MEACANSFKKPRPMTLHVSELADMHRHSMQLAEKLEKLKETQGQMAETLAELVTRLEREVFSAV